MVTALPSTSANRSGIPAGMDLLNRQDLNKGTAFTEEERIELGLQGLLPPQVETLDEQVVRAYEAFQKKDNDLASPCLCPECSTSRHLDVAQEAGEYGADYFRVADHSGATGRALDPPLDSSPNSGLLMFTAVS